MLVELITTVSRGGNYLLNIGPKGDGSMTDGSKEVLLKIGEWMDQYGDSLYGASRYTYAEEPKWGRYTIKGDKLYVHVIKWPKEDEDKVITITVPSSEKNVVSVKYMNSDEQLEYNQDGDSVAINVADKAINSTATVIEVKLEDSVTIA
jgi:alpha-L-fucosidase